MKIVLRWVWQHIFFVITIFLLVFIPLYPKLPLLDVKNTWVYVRMEDFVVAFALLLWLLLLLLRKVTLKTPLTLPILLFWIIGGIATFHGVVLIFPTIANVFPNIAYLSFLRRIEYLSLFFIAYAGMKDKRFLPYVIVALATTLLLVIGYGFGQKYLGFPAYLTMNEEFAKGVAIRLSPLSRVPSTFGGHYDLAGYLVLVIPILTSMMFGFRSLLARVFLGVTVALGFGLLFLTVSRVSFFVLLISLITVFMLQKKRVVMLSLPVLAVVALLFFRSTPALSDRFGNTIKEIDVLVNVTTGEAIGHVEMVPAKSFEKTVIKRKYFRGIDELEAAVRSDKDDSLVASVSATIHFSSLPPQVVKLVPLDTPTGENLPQGTGYINLSLSPVTKRIGGFLYQKSLLTQGGSSAKAFFVEGDFLVKRASAYDLSFTTRFQGEWPRAIEAFKRNILFGSGFSSISLAVDNNYLRILGEIGLLGFASFFSIFLIAGIYIKKVLPEVDSVVVRSFVLGFVAGVVGLMFNALLIDVFEASKIAYLLWLLTGVTLGILHLYQTKHIDLYGEFKKKITSTYATIAYMSLTVLVVFVPMLRNFFVGDDYTWFRWIVEDSTIIRYFTQSDGFFYRPGAKMYFSLMYSLFWLNQTAYHAVSMFLHFIVASLVFVLAKKILQDTKLSVLAAFLFLILSGYAEAVFWISSTGFLFTAMFALFSLLFFIKWEEKKTTIYFILSFILFILGLLFHELGVVIPLLIVVYKFAIKETFSINTFRKFPYALFFFSILVYLGVRYFAQSHWFSGDYSYNLLKLPYNVVGNAIGYFFLTLFGSLSLPFYQALRNFAREHIVFSIIVTLALVYLLIILYRMIIRRMEKEEKRIVVFGFLFFLVALLPFLGLGNIASRYSYLSSIGFILLFVFSLHKLYHFLLSNGREIALGSIVMVVSLFSLLHIIQLQQLHSDWYEAGEKAKRFFISIDGQYGDYWTKEPMEFYFVDVPIRHAEAWVFPVGLKDALWFVFRNDKIRVYQSKSVEQALAQVVDPVRQKVFVFDDRGRVVEKKKVARVR